MIQLDSVICSDNADRQIKIDRLPDLCPLCNNAFEPEMPRLTYLKAGRGNRRLEAVFRCPQAECQSYFIARYFESGHDRALDRYFLNLCLPSNPIFEPFSIAVKRISPDFCLIFDQALAAEKSGLDLVAGPGYRKALEFLIKDYLCHSRSKEEAETIKRLQLGACIRDFVGNQKIREMSLRASWLGNDETHYLRKWDGNIKDLKLLINLTIQWIEIDEITHQVISRMPEGKKG